MADHKDGQAITANGDYEFQINRGSRYLLECFYSAGTGTVTVFTGLTGVDADGDVYQATQDANASTPTDISIEATGTFRSFAIYATGNRLRLTVASAASLRLIPSLTRVATGN